MQATVSRKRRWTSFVLSFSAWLLLLFGGAAVFAQCERRQQSWSYFDGLYMTFVSLTTIGYGDLSPASSCGRSFFVLWSLLGVPTITIAISSLEGPLFRMVHAMARALGKTVTISSPWTLVILIKDRVLQACGFLSVADDTRHQRAGGGHGGYQQRTLPTTPEEYCTTVLDEILGIVLHLDDDPLEVYPIEQWLWFGELLAGRTRRGGRALPDSVITADQFTAKSPLMGPKEEARWFLERLLAVLRRELVAAMTGRDHGQL